eukprot:scaffold7379_cov366-Prasinococcus_capsulatus_cf.AAC.2
MPAHGSPKRHGVQGGGSWYVALVVSLCEMNDAWQWLCGRLFGRTHLVPHLSPKKTLEGYVGGLLLTTLCACVSGTSCMPTRSKLLRLRVLGDHASHPCGLSGPNGCARRGAQLTCVALCTWRR